MAQIRPLYTLAVSTHMPMLEGVSIYITFIIFRSIYVQSLETTTIYCVTRKDYVRGNLILICRVGWAPKLIQINFQNMEKKLVQRCEIEVDGDACKAS